MKFNIKKIKIKKKKKINISLLLPVLEERGKLSQKSIFLSIVIFKRQTFAVTQNSSFKVLTTYLKDFFSVLIFLVPSSSSNLDRTMLNITF